MVNPVVALWTYDVLVYALLTVAAERRIKQTSGMGI